jgi:hypothetical protein
MIQIKGFDRVSVFFANYTTILYNIHYMSINIKTIGGRDYAYQSYRSGKKVIQRYLGPVNDPAIIVQIAAIQKAKSVPPGLIKYFWDVDPKTLNVRRHSRFVLERILELGDLDALRWAQKQYPTALIVEVCLMSRRLSQRSRNFWKIWFEEHDVS